MRSKNRDLMNQIKDFVEEYAISNGGKMPTMRCIGEELGVSHVLVIRYLREMDELGMIYYRDGKITTDKLEKMLEVDELSKNYAEGISAGTGSYNEGVVDQYYAMPPVFVGGRQGKYFTLTVHGDSMVDAGIDPGDVVICKEQTNAEVDDIIVAWVDGEGNTLKRLCRDDDGLYLWAENNSWLTQKRDFGRRFSIQGVAIKVLKDI